MDQNLNENYKYTQDNLYKTKYNYNDNKISVDKQYKPAAEKTIFTHNQLYNSEKKYTDNSKIDFYLNYKMANKINDE